MRRLLRSLGGAVLAGLACLPVPAARAQEPPATPLPPGVHAVVGAPVFEEDLGPPEKSGWSKPVRTYVANDLHAHGLACWARFDNPTCSNLCTQLTFVFGSCRSFFGEPCFGRPVGPPDGLFGQPGRGCGSAGCRQD